MFIGNYETKRKTKKYWKTLVYHRVDIAVCNSYILYSESILEDERSRHTHRHFMELLTKQLARTTGEVTVPSPLGHPPRSSVRATHQIEFIPQYKYCTLCTALKRKYAKTDKQCQVCKIPLCFTPDRNCFSEWHSTATESLSKTSLRLEISIVFTWIDCCHFASQNVYIS